MANNENPIRIHPSLVGKTMPAAQKELLRQSLNAVGQLHPILITDDNYIVEGTIRYQVLLEEGFAPEFKNICCHSGIGLRLPNTKAYRHSTITEEKAQTKLHLEALAPWTWSAKPKARSGKPKPKGESQNDQCQKRRADLWAWMKTHQPVTRHEIQIFLKSKGHVIPRSFVTDENRSGKIKKVDDNGTSAANGHRCARYELA